LPVRFRQFGRARTNAGAPRRSRLYFPRYFGQPDVSTDLGTASGVAPGDGETVLVVDDEPTLRMLISDVLEENGYKVLTAINGPTALAHLKSDATIDLLITDIGLPSGMNGRQLAGEARKHRPDLKVLFITGFAENAAVGHGHLDHDVDVMTKPFEITSFAEKVKELIDRQGESQRN
jgi:CheY-like chemotaxis protein